MKRITSRAEVERMLSDGWLLLEAPGVHNPDFPDLQLVRGGETASPWRNAVSSLTKASALELDHSDERGKYYRLKRQPAGPAHQLKRPNVPYPDFCFQPDLCNGLKRCPRRISCCE